MNVSIKYRILKYTQHEPLKIKIVDTVPIYQQSDFVHKLRKSKCQHQHLTLGGISILALFKYYTTCE